MEGRSGRLAVTSRSLWARALHSCRSCGGRWKRCHSSVPAALRSLVLLPFMLRGRRGETERDDSGVSPELRPLPRPLGGPARTVHTAGRGLSLWIKAPRK